MGRTHCSPDRNCLSLKNSGVNIGEITDLNGYFTGVIAGYSSIELLMAGSIASKPGNF